MNAFRLNTLWKRLTDTSWPPSWCHHVPRDKEWLSRNKHWQSYTNSNDEKFWKYWCKSWSKYLSSASLHYTSEDIKHPNTSDKEMERLFAKSLQREAERYVSQRLHPNSKVLKILPRIWHIVSQISTNIVRTCSSDDDLNVIVFWVCWTIFKNHNVYDERTSNIQKRWLFAFTDPDPKEFRRIGNFVCSHIFGYRD